MPCDMPRVSVCDDGIGMFVVFDFIFFIWNYSFHNFKPHFCFYLLAFLIIVQMKMNNQLSWDKKQVYFENFASNWLKKMARSWNLNFSQSQSNSKCQQTSIKDHYWEHFLTASFFFWRDGALAKCGGKIGKISRHNSWTSCIKILEVNCFLQWSFLKLTCQENIVLLSLLPLRHH